MHSYSLLRRPSHHGRRESRLGPWGRFLEAPQDFRDTPGLRHAPAWREGRFRIEDLADRSDARAAEVFGESVEHPPRSGAILGMRVEPGIHVRSDQPRPHGALVIGSVSRSQVAV